MLTRRNPATGIDLGHHAVKLVRLERGGSGAPQLTHWGVEEILAAREATVEDRAGALARLLKRLDLRPRQLGRVASSVGGRDVYLRQVSMPRMSEPDLRRALPYEAKKHLPLDGNPLCFDLQLLNGIEPPPMVDGGDGGTPTREVLLVAAPRSRRDETLSVLERTGVHPEILDAEPLPVVNAILAAYPPPEDAGWQVMLDLGARNSVLAAVLPDGCFYARPLEFTGDLLTASIEAEMGIDRGQAEIVKRELQDGGKGQDATVLPAVEGLVREVEETIRFLRVRRRQEAVSRIYLSGGGALLLGLREILTRAVGVEVLFPDPFRDLAAGSRKRPGPADAPWLVGALGLARWWD